MAGSRTATPIIDGRSRVIGVCAGRPDDPSWDPLHKRVAREVDTARNQMNFGPKDVNHRRMADPSKAVGDSFGGGQKVCFAVCVNGHRSLASIRFRERSCKVQSMPQYLQAC
jgi:hypothetical protein